MSEWIIITNKGFSSDDWSNLPVVLPEAILSGPKYWQQFGKIQTEYLGKVQLKLGNDFQVEALESVLTHLRAISIDFPTANDGRGFSLARRLRELGYQSILRAQGHCVVDHYRHAIQCGFDQIAISPELAKRMPESYWKKQVNIPMPNYQEKLQPGSLISRS